MYKYMYKNKYLKYKQKYLSLRGGASPIIPIDEFLKLTVIYMNNDKYPITSFISSFSNMSYMLEQNEELILTLTAQIIQYNDVLSKNQNIRENERKSGNESKNLVTLIYEIIDNNSTELIEKIENTDVKIACEKTNKEVSKNRILFNYFVFCFSKSINIDFNNYKNTPELISLYTHYNERMYETGNPPPAKNLLFFSQNFDAYNDKHTYKLLSEVYKKKEETLISKPK